MTDGRRRPYTVIGIRRLTCYRASCLNRAGETYQVCADGCLYRPICGDCARALDRAVLDFLGGRPNCPVRPRRRPYAWRTIRRRACVRPGCGGWAAEQWDFHGVGAGFLPVCAACDVALNRLVLEFMGDPYAAAKIARYRERMEIL